jgi:hypothetical protein
MTMEEGSPEINAQGKMRFRSRKIFRVTFTLALWISCVGLPVYLSLKVDDWIEIGLINFGTPFLTDVGVLPVRLLPMLPLAVVARKVSYRSRDCLMYLIPVYGAAVFPFIIFWRFAYLPLRDWPLRPDESGT